MAKKKTNLHQKTNVKAASEPTEEEIKKNRIKAYVGVAVAFVIFAGIIAVIIAVMNQGSGIDYNTILPGTWEADDALGSHVVLEINDDLSGTYTSRGYSYDCECKISDQSNAVKVDVSFEDEDKNEKEYLLYKFNDEYILGFDVSNDENAFRKTSE